MLTVPSGSKVSEDKVRLAFVHPWDPGDAAKHYVVGRHLGDHGSCVLFRRRFKKIKALHQVQLRRVGDRDPTQLRLV